MEENEIWLSENLEEIPEEEDTTNSTSFNVALTVQGQPGDYRTRNRYPGERQRAAVSVFHGGKQRKPAFRVACNARAMIHGQMGPYDPRPATLLVYECKFYSARGVRLKGADLLFEFHPLTGKSEWPKVVAVSPKGLMKMEESLQHEEVKRGLELSVSPAISPVNLALAVSGEQSFDKVAAYHTAVYGDNPQSDDWGNYYQAHFALAENRSQNTGIPSVLTFCILLEREDDSDFICRPYIDVTPDFKTAITTLSGFRAYDEEITFSVGEKPFDKLDKSLSISPDNLGAVDLNQLCDCTMHHEYKQAVKKTQLGSPD